MINKKVKITTASLKSHPDLLTVKDIQNILKIGRSKTYLLVKNGAIKSIRIGAEYRIPKVFLLQYLNENIA